MFLLLLHFWLKVSFGARRLSDVCDGLLFSSNSPLGGHAKVLSLLVDVVKYLKTGGNTN